MNFQSDKCRNPQLRYRGFLYYFTYLLLSLLLLSSLIIITVPQLSLFKVNEGNKAQWVLSYREREPALLRVRSWLLGPVLGMRYRQTSGQ